MNLNWRASTALSPPGVRGVISSFRHSSYTKKVIAAEGATYKLLQNCSYKLSGGDGEAINKTRSRQAPEGYGSVPRYEWQSYLQCVWNHAPEETQDPFISEVQCSIVKFIKKRSSRSNEQFEKSNKMREEDNTSLTQSITSKPFAHSPESLYISVELLHGLDHYRRLGCWGVFQTKSQ
jgi:hypothetical protein